MTRTGASLALLALCAAGCAATSELSRQRPLLRELDAFAFQRPEEEVWAGTRRLLADRGLELAGADAEAVGQKLGTVRRFTTRALETRVSPGGRVLETGWGAAGVRYRAEARTDASGVRVTFTRISQAIADPSSDGASWRDPELELELVRRLAPEEARAIEARALGQPPATPTQPAPAAAPPASRPPPPSTPTSRSGL